MTKLTPPKICQLAYFVPDIRRAALHWHQVYGAGPFFVAEHIELEEVSFFGRPAQLDHSSAYGWLGNIMIELVQQNCTNKSVFSDQPWGLHHCAYFADSLETELDHRVQHGMQRVMQAKTLSGIRFAFLASALNPPQESVRVYGSLAPYLEVYEEHPSLRAFYTLVENSAQDGTDNTPLRKL